MKQYMLFCTFLLLGIPNLTGQEVQLHHQDIEYNVKGSEVWSTTAPEVMREYRIRRTVHVTGVKPSLQYYSVYVSMMASAEVYWDGVLIGLNGRIGDSRSTEKPGKLFISYLIPDSLMTTGDHQITLHTSNFNARGKVRLYALFVADYIEPMIGSIQSTAFIHIYAGCFLIIGLFFGVRYFGNPSDLTVLVFSLLCLAFFGLLILEFIRTYYSYDYDWHFTRLQIILGITILISTLLPLFFVLRFQFYSWIKRGLIVIAVVQVVLVLLTPYGYDFSTNVSMILGLASASLICGYALYLKKSDSLIGLIGVLPLMLALVIFQSKYDSILYIGFAFLIFLMLVSLARKEKDLVRLKEEALLRSSRLELELLKKNIQPHFLMNSITSAINWIEVNPKSGVQLLMALSKEFDILLDISDKQLIPIVKELELCRTHLEIMGFRKEQSYRLSTTGIDEYEIIPPAIFLTIIENGISYQNVGKEPVAFDISKIQKGAKIIYQVIALGNNNPEHDSKSEDGTGLKYVKARLEENYSGQWSLTSEPVENGWITEIQFTE